jgi:methyl-accepting chemotaxis protein
MSQGASAATPLPVYDKAAQAQIRARQAEQALSMSKYVLWASAATMVLSGVMWVLFRQYTQLLASVACIVPVVASAALHPVLHRQGKMRVGISLLLGSILIMLLFDALLLPEVLPSIGIGYVLVLLMGSQLLGGTGRRWLTAFCVLGFGTDVVLVNTVTRPWFLPLDERAGVVVGSLLALSTVLVGALIARQTVAGQENAVRQSEKAGWEVIKQAANETALRERVQETVRAYVAYLEEVGDGNLAVRVPLDEDDVEQAGADDPLIILGQQLNDTISRLQRMIVRIREAAGNLSAAAADIMSTTAQQVSSANEQSASVSQATASVDEIRTIAAQLVSRAQMVAETAQRTIEISRTGQEVAEQAIAGMAGIKARVDVIDENILALSDRTNQIGKIIDTVNTLASQSNMLALNAAVEAARAGEHGKGFAVVAEEVRSLAERSRKATAQVQEILSDIQGATNKTAMATEEGKKGVDAGVDLVAQMDQAIEQLSVTIDESAQAAMQMVAGGQQQTSGMDQIAMVMQSINEATLQSLDSTRQTEQTVQSLNELARELTAAVEQYRL